ncbi:MAG: hypothetical protein WC137_02895 [Alphaproteobacteria bacterium]
MIRLKGFKKIKLFPGKKLPGGLPVNWQQNYPLFNFEITSSGNYVLNNKTGYLTNELISPDLQANCLKLFSRKNIAEGGKAIKRVALVSCMNASEYGFYKFTNGWIPNQDLGNKELNTDTACLIEYKDGTHTGWLKWSSGNTLKGSMDQIYILLFLLANSDKNHCRLCAREARSKYVETLANKRIK